MFDKRLSDWDVYLEVLSLRIEDVDKLVVMMMYDDIDPRSSSAQVLVGTSNMVLL